MDGLRSLAVLALACLAAQALGCATVVTPKSIKAKPPQLTGSWQGPVSVAALQQENPHPRFNANGVVFDIDPNAFSANLADLVSDSLRAAGTEVGEGGKSVRLEVLLLDFMFQGPCYVDYNVYLGNGETFGQQTTGDSGNFGKACRLALEEAVARILQDERSVRYLGGS